MAQSSSVGTVSGLSSGKLPEGGGSAVALGPEGARPPTDSASSSQPESSSAGRKASEEAGFGKPGEGAPDQAAKGLVGRIRAGLQWARATRSRLVVVVGASVMTAMSLLGGLSLLMMEVFFPAPQPISLEMALEMLDQGAYAEARVLAEKLLRGNDLLDSELGGPVFILGAVTAYEAQELPEKEAILRYLVAASYLEEARVRGFPPGREAEGWLLLGESLFYSGQWVSARPVLKKALQLNPHRKTPLSDMLVQVCAEAVPPLLKEALQYNSVYLADRWLPQVQRDQALLRQAELQLRLGDLEACRKTLAQLPGDPALRAGRKWIEGQMVLAEARAARSKLEQPAAWQKYREAIQLFRQAQTEESSGLWAMRRAQYYIGLCLEEMGDLDGALLQMQRVQSAFPDTPEAAAAAWKEAGLAQQLEKPSEVLAAYRRAVGMVGLPKTFHNPWLGIEEIRAQCLKAHQDFIRRNDFPTAFSLVETVAPVFSTEWKTELLARTLHQWAQAEAAKADLLSYPARVAQQRQARRLYRQAGWAYEQLAELKKQTKEYTNILWESAENYLAGQDYLHAVSVLEEYLRQESRARRAAALARLGQALLALNRVDEALEALTDCIDFHPRDVAAYQARLLAAQAWLEKGQPEKAAQMLQANLDGQLAPSSLEWRQSLFAMGRLRHLEGDYQKAIPLLQEAIRRYPNDAEALEARYLLADCYGRIALQLRQELEASQIRHVRLSRMQESEAAFQKALSQYKQLVNILNQIQINRPLTPGEKILQRNSLFGLGEVAARLADYETALDAYTAVANRFQSEPVALVAYFQMAEVYRKLGHPDRAKGMLRQAQLVLERLPESAAFTQTTPFVRTEWSQLLERQLAELTSSDSQSGKL